MQPDRNEIEAAVELFHQARKRLKPDTSFRLRVLLDMILLELARELKRTPERHELTGRPDSSGRGFHP